MRCILAVPVQGIIHSYLMQVQAMTRSEARRLNLMYYDATRPCKLGHTKRYTSTRRCCECTASQGSEWRRVNVDRVKQTSAAYYTNHEARIQARTHKYYESNKQAYKNRSHQWRRLNPHKIVEHNRLRNTRLQQAIPGWFEDDLVKQLYAKRDELNERYDWELTVDHIIPLNPRDGSVCGLHCWANLQLPSKGLNDSKRDNYITDW
jgi:hypothetical protein